MLAVNQRPKRFYAEGILSFIKGCDRFLFGQEPTSTTKWRLTQESNNPSTYTKLSCFLPWVAEQYGLDYDDDETLEKDCLEGQGDPNDGLNTCRSTVSDRFDVEERECIFPFYYQGKRYDECILYRENDFVIPIFRCPVRNVTSKREGINDYLDIGLNDRLCPANPEDFDSDLDTDPTKECFFFIRRAPFQQCKNNCPGGM